MTPWPTWPAPPAPPAASDAHVERARPRRWAKVAVVLPVLAAGLHVAAIALAPSVAPRRVEVVVTPPSAPPAPSPPASPPPAPIVPTGTPGTDAQALLRTFVGVAVNEAHPEVVLAWTMADVALTTDDGATWRRWPLPGSGAAEAPVGTVTGRGTGLLSLGPDAWLAVRAAGVESLHPPSGGVVNRFASDAHRTVALMKEPDDVLRTVISTDGGVSWRGGPDAPQGAYDVTWLPGGRLAVSYAWSASCGGGAEGVMTLRPGDREWTAIDQPHVGHLTPDLHVVNRWCDGADHALCAWPPGPDARPIVQPSSSRAPGFFPWFASGRDATYAGDGGVVHRMERGAFRVVDRAAPSSLGAVVVDGRGRLVGIANGHVVRWSPPRSEARAVDGADAAGTWSVHLP